MKVKQSEKFRKIFKDRENGRAIIREILKSKISIAPSTNWQVITLSQ